MMAAQRFLVVVSFFEPRPMAPLEGLVHALSHTPAGADFDIVVVVNRTTSGRLALPVSIGAVTTVVDRPNQGMNIGAWDHGWRHFPEYDGYLFLQDECELKSECWLNPFVDAASAPGTGLIGESWNTGWDRSWDAMKIAVEGQRMPGHDIDGIAANRVDVYREFMSRRGVATGQKAGHLRSLVWFANRHTLVAMNGFLQGDNFGECIAAEIAATKSVEALGLRAQQVDVQPFKYFGHREWRQGPDGRWRHGAQNVLTKPRLSRSWRAVIARVRASIQ